MPPLQTRPWLARGGRCSHLLSPWSISSSWGSPPQGLWGRLRGPRMGAGSLFQPQSLAEAGATQAWGQEQRGAAKWGHPKSWGHPEGSWGCGARADAAAPRPGLGFFSLSEAFNSTARSAPAPRCRRGGCAAGPGGSQGTAPCRQHPGGLRPSKAAPFWPLWRRGLCGRAKSWALVLERAAGLSPPRTALAQGCGHQGLCPWGPRRSWGTPLSSPGAVQGGARGEKGPMASAGAWGRPAARCWRPRGVCLLGTCSSSWVLFAL